MDFIWNDGGRARSGFVGQAADCVTRAIAIATGRLYREVYEELGLAAEKSPRNGMNLGVASSYLLKRQFAQHDCHGQALPMDALPKGIVVALLFKDRGRSRHLCAVIDGVIYDTWNPYEDEYVVWTYWTRESIESSEVLPIVIGANEPASQQQEWTQQAFDKILNRLRALDRTASNHASTEGEKHNALRMMQDLMLRHNLSRDDIVAPVETGPENFDKVLFTRMACPVNGRRACSWEKSLAHYVTHHIFPSIQWYFATRGPRTLFWFVGPVADVKNALSLFQELLLTIATSAQLQYGGHSRGSGASYAEGYVQGLPTSSTTHTASNVGGESQQTLIRRRMLTIQNQARKWLANECNILLSTSRGAGRYDYDENAHRHGRQDGATHEVQVPNAPKRIGHREIAE